MQKNKSQNKNFNYILTVIDIFSKFAWAIPIKNKTGDSITRAFEIIFKDRIPTKLHTDKGLEFINKSTQNLFKRKESTGLQLKTKRKLKWWNALIEH